MLQLLERGDRSAQEPATRMGHILLFPCLFWEYIFWQFGRDNIGCVLLFLAWCRRTLNFLIVCAVSESWSWWSSFFAQAPAQSISQRTATTFVYIVLYFHFLYISHIKSTSSTWHTSPTSHVHQLHHLHHLTRPLLHRSQGTEVVAQKFSHKRALWEGLGRASRGLDGGFRRAWRRLAGLEMASRGLQGGLRRASRGLEKGFRGLEGGLLEGGFKGAWEGFQGGFKEACQGLQGGLKRASPSWSLQGLEGGFKGAWEGLQGGFQGGLRRASRGLDGEGFEGGLKGAWEGLQGGFKAAWEGFQGGFKGAWEGLQGGVRRASRGLQGGFKPFSPSSPAPPGSLQAPLEGYLRRWWLGSSPQLDTWAHWTPLQLSFSLVLLPRFCSSTCRHVHFCFLGLSCTFLSVSWTFLGSLELRYDDDPMIAVKGSRRWHCHIWGSQYVGVLQLYLLGTWSCGCLGLDLDLFLNLCFWEFVLFQGVSLCSSLCACHVVVWCARPDSSGPADWSLLG